MVEMQKDLLNTEAFVFDGYVWVCGILFASSRVVQKEGGFTHDNCTSESFFLKAQGLFVGLNINSFAPGSWKKRKKHLYWADEIFLFSWVRSLETLCEFQWDSSILFLLAFVIYFLPSCLSKILMCFGFFFSFAKSHPEFSGPFVREKSICSGSVICSQPRMVLFLLLAMKIVMWNREVMKLFIYHYIHI